MPAVHYKSLTKLTSCSARLRAPCCGACAPWSHSSLRTVNCRDGHVAVSTVTVQPSLARNTHTVEKRISEETLPRTDLQVDGERQRTTTEGTGLEEKSRHGTLGMIRPLDSCSRRSKKPHEEASRSSDLPAQKWKKPFAHKQVSSHLLMPAKKLHSSACSWKTPQ